MPHPVIRVYDIGPRREGILHRHKMPSLEAPMPATDIDSSSRGLEAKNMVFRDMQDGHQLRFTWDLYVAGCDENSTCCYFSMPYCGVTCVRRRTTRRDVHIPLRTPLALETT